MKLISRFLLPVLLGLSLAACGGGGDDATADAVDQDTTVTLDTVADTTVTPDTVVSPDVEPDVVVNPETIEETSPEVVCTPDCTDKVCGPDGCGGFCGTEEGGVCPNPDNLEFGDAPFCVNGECLTFCTPFPEPGTSETPPYAIATPIPVGVMDPATMSVPGPDNLTLCFDYDNDGTPDNGLANLNSLYLTLLNGQFASLEVAIMLQFAGLTTFTNATDFDLNGFLGEAGTADYVVYDQSYAEGDTCGPYVYFPDSDIVAGTLGAGPHSFTVTLPMWDYPTNITLYDFQVKGNVTEGGETGVAMSAGVVGAWLSRTEIEYVLAQIDTICAGEDAPELCGYYSSFKDQIDAELPKIFDLDLDDDGYMDAASLCMLFGLSKGKITAHMERNWDE